MRRERPDLYQRVIAGEMTARKAGIIAGWYAHPAGGTFATRRGAGWPEEVEHAVAELAAVILERETKPHPPEKMAELRHRERQLTSRV